MKREPIDENHCSIQESPFDLRNSFSVLAALLTSIQHSSLASRKVFLIMSVLKNVLFEVGVSLFVDDFVPDINATIYIERDTS